MSSRARILELGTATLLVALATASAYQPPVERLPNGALWSRASVGVEGGVPNGWPVATTLSPAAGGADNTSAINAALQKASFGNRVVLLSAGNFPCSGEIALASGTILRGAGPDQTTITATGNAPAVGFVAGGNYEHGLQFTALTADRPAGSTTFSFPSLPSDVAASLHAGSYLYVTQINDGGLDAMGDGSILPDTTHVVKGGREGGTQEALNQVVRISAITKGAYPGGTFDVTFTPPLRWSYTTALQAHVGLVWGGGNGGFISNAGLEDLTVTRSPASKSNLGGTNTIRATFAADCWIKNVTSGDSPFAHIGLATCKNFEIRHCFLHGGWQPTSGGGGGGYGILMEASHDCLIEDNILSSTSDPIMAPILVDYGSSGNVLAYNYIPASAMISSHNLVEETAIHAGFPMFNLFEGNIGQKFTADNFHGGSRYHTLFRNWYKGTQTGALNYRDCIAIAEENLYYNVVGNVLGVNGSSSALYDAGMGPSAPDVSVPHIYVLGWASTARQYRYFNPNRATPITPPDQATDIRVAATTIILGNWTPVDANNGANPGQLWNDSSADHSLRASYYYSSKPAFFASLAWPAIDPSVGPPSSDAVIPAAYRFLNGAEPSDGPRPAAPKGLRIGP